MKSQCIRTRYTAFAVPGMGLFEFSQLPFGLSGAPAVFQELMDKVVGPELEPYCICYLDDIILATEGFEKNHKILEKILIHLRDANVTINPEESFFCVPEAKYLGFIIDRDGFRSDPEKVSAVLNIPPPRTVKQLKSFLGFITWYEKLISNSLTISEPLKLTHKNGKYVWLDECQEAFVRLRALLATAPVLSRPSDELEFTLQVDASNCGLGCVLTQDIDG